jgi:hypothetical protein
MTQTPSLSRFRSRGRCGQSCTTALRHLIAGRADDLDITAERMVQCGQWVGGVRRCSLGVCRRTFPTRDPSVMVAPMVAETSGQERILGQRRGWQPEGQNCREVVERKGYWLRGLDLNQRPLGYEPNELPDCSTPHLDSNNRSTQGQTRANPGHRSA